MWGLGEVAVPVRWWALFCAFVVAAVFSSCDGDDGRNATPGPTGPPRSFMLGFSSLPRELNAESYADAIEFAGEHSELVLVQRTVPWSDFLPGAQVSEDTARNTAREREAIDAAGLRLFFAIDPTDGATGRDRIGDLPADMTGRRFDDPDVRAALLSYTEYIARNYQPGYMAIGVEMNLYYERNRDDFANFQSLYDQAYHIVKEFSPETQVTVTLQYEDLRGLLPRDDEHFASWQLVRAFDPNIDFIGISTYPSLVFSDPAQIPEEYYSQLDAFTDRPIAIAEMGYASGPQGGAPPGNENAQAGYLSRMMDETEDMGMPFAVWFAIWDPVYAANTPHAIFQSIGLLRTDETEKFAWTIWEQSAGRPFQPEEAEASR